MLNLVIRRLASVIAMVVTAAALSPARAGDDVGGHLDKSLNGLRAGQHESLIRLTEADAGKRRTVYLGLGKSTMIEMPRPARDIIMSNPQAVDAVVQSSNRIFLMAKGFGESTPSSSMRMAISSRRSKSTSSARPLILMPCWRASSRAPISPPKF